MPNTNFPDGVSNAVLPSALQTFPAIDPTRVCSEFDDFTSIDAAAGITQAKWRVLGVNPVVPTAAAVQYGRAVLSPAGATDSTFLQLASAQGIAAGSLPVNFFFASNRDVWFSTIFQASQALDPNIVAGLFPSVAAAGNPVAAADGVFFQKLAASTTISLKIIKTAVGNTLLTLPIPLADATDIKLGFHWSANSQTIFAYVNDQRAGSISGVNILNMPAVGLLPLIGHLNATNARTSSWDYVFAGQARFPETGVL